MKRKIVLIFTLALFLLGKKRILYSGNFTESYIEKNPQYKEENVFREMLENYKFVCDLPMKWKFKLDEKNLGEKEKWYSKEYDDKDWKEIEIGKWWEDFGYEYDGYAWYRVEMEISESLKGKRIYLGFGGVDEAAKIFVNGRFVDEFDVGPVGWDKPFIIEITDFIEFGKKNLICIKVYDSSFYGGIWQKIKLLTK